MDLYSRGLWFHHRASRRVVSDMVPKGHLSLTDDYQIMFLLVVGHLRFICDHWYRGKPFILADRRDTNKQTNKQTSKQASKQANKIIYIMSFTTVSCGNFLISE